MKTLCTLLVIGSVGLGAVAQESKISLTARENTQAASTQLDTQPEMTTTSSNLPFCPPKTCLYYAGDFDSTDSNANGLLNGNSANGNLEEWVWVGVKPPKAVTVTGVTFNQFFSSGFVGTGPTPFQTMVSIVQGRGGTLVCNTSGNATLRQYGESDFGLVQYSYTVKRLAKACTITKPSKTAPSTYVNLLPTSGNGYGYVANVEDTNPKNRRGWKNDLDDCYAFAYDGPQYAPCNNYGFLTSSRSL